MFVWSFSCRRKHVYVIERHECPLVRWPSIVLVVSARQSGNFTRAPVHARAFCCRTTIVVSLSDATWLSTNFGIIVCIECSGIHRDLGVHISRIQSLTLDNVGTAQLLLARHMTNQAFNEVMEATLRHNLKPSPTSTM